MTISNWLTIIGLVVVPATAIYLFVYRLDNRVSTIEGRCENHQKVIDSIASLNTRLDKVTNDNEIFWRVIGPHLENIIHSPKAATRDALVAKLVRGHIEADECRMLIGLLREAIGSDRWDADKRLAGAWLLARACQKLADLGAADHIDSGGCA